MKIIKYYRYCFLFVSYSITAVTFVSVTSTVWLVEFSSDLLLQLMTPAAVKIEIATIIIILVVMFFSFYG